MAQKKEMKNVEAKGNINPVGIGIGLTTAAVAAASAYFLYGSKSAAKNRKVVKSWALKAKAEVLEKLEDAQEMTQKEYEEVVKAVSGAYVGAKNASKKDIIDFTKEMKDHWKAIEKAAAPMKKTAEKKVKTAVKKVEKVGSDMQKTVNKVAPPAKKAAKKVAK